MQFTTVRSKEKDYYIYLKSEKLVHSNQQLEKMLDSYLEVEKSASQLFRACQTLLQLFGEREKWIHAIWRLKNVVRNCQEQEKDYYIYLQIEKLVHSNQEHKKIFSKLFRSGKNYILSISSLTNTVAAIWREKNVDPSYLETKKCSSQLLGARKKIITSI